MHSLYIDYHTDEFSSRDATGGWTDEGPGVIGGWNFMTMHLIGFKFLRTAGF